MTATIQVKPLEVDPRHPVILSRQSCVDMKKWREASAELHQLIVDFESYLEQTMFLRQGTLEISGRRGRAPDMLGWRLNSMSPGSEDQAVVDSFARLEDGKSLSKADIDHVRGMLSGWVGRTLITGVSYLSNVISRRRQGQSLFSLVRIAAPVLLVYRVAPR